MSPTGPAIAYLHQPGPDRLDRGGMMMPQFPSSIGCRITASSGNDTYAFSWLTPLRCARRRSPDAPSMHLGQIPLTEMSPYLR
jgi:hypothetical protein